MSSVMRNRLFSLKAIKITIKQEENLWMIYPNEQIDCLRRRY